MNPGERLGVGDPCRNQHRVGRVTQVVAAPLAGSKVRFRADGHPRRSARPWSGIGGHTDSQPGGFFRGVQRSGPATAKTRGNCSQRSPSRSWPVSDRRPPICLKKTGTPAATHCFTSVLAHSGLIGRARCPLSPPMMTQSRPGTYSPRPVLGSTRQMSSHRLRSTGPNSGSTLTNRTAAGVSIR